jgi:hypothetical protein
LERLTLPPLIDQKRPFVSIHATFSGFYPGGAEAAFGYTIPNILVDHSMLDQRERDQRPAHSPP